MPARPSERTIVFLVGAIHFVNVLDFMIVMPLGPDFAKGLGIATSQIGTIGGSYTAAAAVAGIAGTFFLDRFDRRIALAVAMLGLCVGTALGALATGLGTLIAARVVAGLFGGPAASLSFSVIADVIPVARRGKAMGAVMGAFAVASVVGLPVGLELARRGGWRLPFLAVAALGLCIAAAAVWTLPPLTTHIEARKTSPDPGLAPLLRNPLVQLSCVTAAFVMAGSFIVIPNISAYVQHNLGFPRARLGSLYFVGGIVSFFVTSLGGRLCDRFGPARVGTAGALSLIAVVYAGFGQETVMMPVIYLFPFFFLAMGLRNVAYQTLTSMVPQPAERARFMSLQSAVAHLASAAGAFTSSQLLTQLPNERLQGMGHVAAVSIGLTALVPVLLWRVQAGVRARIPQHVQ